MIIYAQIQLLLHNSIGSYTKREPWNGKMKIQRKNSLNKQHKLYILGVNLCFFLSTNRSYKSIRIYCHKTFFFLLNLFEHSSISTNKSFLLSHYFLYDFSLCSFTTHHKQTSQFSQYSCLYCSHQINENFNIFTIFFLLSLLLLLQIFCFLLLFPFIYFFFQLIYLFHL